MSDAWLWGLLWAVAMAAGVRVWLLRRGAAPDSDEGPLPEDFVADVIRVLGERGVAAHPVPDTFALEVPAGHWLDLRPAYLQFKASDGPEAAGEVVAELVEAWASQGLLQAPSAVDSGLMGFADVADDLLVEVASVAQLSAEVAEAMLRAEDLAEVDPARVHPPSLQLSAELVGRPALREGARLSAVDAYLEGWGVSAHAVLQRLQVNLARQARIHPMRGVAPGVLRSGFSDPRDLCTLLMPLDFFASLGLPDDVIVWPLAPSRVFVSSTDRLADLMELADAAGVQEPLVCGPLVRCAEGPTPWRRLEVATDHALWGPLAHLHARQRLRDYQRVEEPLSYLAAKGAHPAPARVRLRSDGAPGVEASFKAPALVPADVDRVEVVAGDQSVWWTPAEIEARAGASRHWCLPAYLVVEEVPQL